MLTLPPSLDRPPVHPALSGKFISSMGFTHIAGKDYVLEGTKELLETGQPIAVDIETEGLGELAYRIKCVVLATTDKSVLLDPRDSGQYRLIQDTFCKASSLIFHNSAYDVPILGVLGLMTLQDVDKVFDTLIYARLAESDVYIPKTLEACAQRYLGLQPNTWGIALLFTALGITKAQGYKTVDIDSPAYMRGAIDDTITTARLLPEVQAAALKTLTDHPFGARGVSNSEALRLLHREQIINRIFLKRSIKGLRVDLDFLDDFNTKNESRIHQLHQQLTQADITPGHGGSLVSVLDKLGALPTTYPRTAKTQTPSAAKKDLDSLDHPLAHLHVEYKELVKIRDDYLVKTGKLAAIDGRIHPTVGVLSASATGRMSISDPPLQQFPDGARGVVLADEGREFTSIDWSQIEPVVLLNIAGDTQALANYEDGTGDLYTSISEFAGVPRSQAKVILLGQMYGQGITKLSQSLGISTEEGQKVRDKVFSPIPMTSAFMRKIRNIGGQYGKMVTLSGRVLTVPPATDEHGKPDGYAGYKAVNYLVQGSAYDILAESLIRIHESGLDDAIYLAMHDELVVDSQAAQDVSLIMQQPPERLIEWSKRIPVLRTDMQPMGNRWAKV